VDWILKLKQWQLTTNTASLLFIYDLTDGRGTLLTSRGYSCASLQELFIICSTSGKKDPMMVDIAILALYIYAFV